MTTSSVEFYFNVHVNISLLHTNEVMNCRYPWLSTAEMLTPRGCEIGDLCHLLLSLLGLEVTRTTAGSSELTLFMMAFTLSLELSSCGN